MKFHRNCFLALIATASAASSVAHAEVVNIPWSAAIQATPYPQDCIAYFPTAFGSGGNECYLDFPLTVPVGHTIQQIAVFHGTDNMFPGGTPIFDAYLQTDMLTPPYTDQMKFHSSSTSQVPSNTIDRHQLMAQINKVYLDQFQVAPGTIYHLHVSLQNGAWISGVEVNYN